MYILVYIIFPHLHISQESCTLFREPVQVQRGGDGLLFFFKTQAPKRSSTLS